MRFKLLLKTKRPYFFDAYVNSSEYQLNTLSLFNYGQTMCMMSRKE